MTRILLLGLMASGKSTLAKAISNLSGWPAIDNDVLLERATGSTAAQLLATHGEQHLRAAESDVLTLTLSLPAPMVAGVAAGTVLDLHNRERMRSGGHVVWLRTPVSTLVRRVSRPGHRPFVTDDPAAVLRAMAAEREPLFAEIAHQVLDMDSLRPASAARQVLDAVALRS